VVPEQMDESGRRAQLLDGYIGAGSTIDRLPAREERDSKWPTAGVQGRSAGLRREVVFPLRGCEPRRQGTHRWPLTGFKREDDPPRREPGGHSATDSDLPGAHRRRGGQRTLRCGGKFHPRFQGRDKGRKPIVRHLLGSGTAGTNRVEFFRLCGRRLSRRGESPLWAWLELARGSTPRALRRPRENCLLVTTNGKLLQAVDGRGATFLAPGGQRDMIEPRTYGFVGVSSVESHGVRNRPAKIRCRLFLQLARRRSPSPSRPLREHLEDLPSLAQQILRKTNRPIPRHASIHPTFRVSGQTIPGPANLREPGARCC